MHQWGCRQSCLPPPWGCQSLSQRRHSRAGCRLRTALPCPAMGPTEPGHPAEPPAWGWQSHPPSHCWGPASRRTSAADRSLWQAGALPPAHRVPGAAWLPRDSHPRRWHWGPAHREPHARKVPCSSPPCCCVHGQETVLTWRKW